MVALVSCLVAASMMLAISGPKKPPVGWFNTIPAIAWGTRWSCAEIHD